MNLNEIMENARDKLTPVCKVCPVCNGIACRGQLPGMGSAGTGESFINNFKALANYRINLKTLHNIKDPDLKVKLFNKDLNLPVILAAVAGASLNLNNSITEEELLESWFKGAQVTGILAMTGDGPDPNIFKTVLRVGQHYKGIVIPIIKPRPQKELMEKICQAEEIGAAAVGIDIDAAALIHKNIKGLSVEPKTLYQIREITQSTGLPVILKGIMTAVDAEIAVEAGVSAIVVSNHGGRAIDHCPGTAEVLSDISRAVGENITVLVDGGIRTGLDVLKCLALGAHGVLIGRPAAIAAVGGGPLGVKALIENIKNDLIKSMILTGTHSVMDVCRDILYDR